ncbi:MAG TPA: hypothetical protein PL020_03335 [Candidatus Cloacimonadota bacterium]|nr:hypothetical protein [Candidatus Cloacimonadota bacterium]HPF08752.1 hypothetical protein [Candidatus Cloacimonadota bacterium]
MAQQSKANIQGKKRHNVCSAKPKSAQQKARQQRNSAKQAKASAARKCIDQGSNLHVAARNAYEGKVIAESMQRAGKNPQLKGVIHEVLIKDKINSNPANIVKGVKASLTKNPNAKTVDIVVKQGNKVVSRIQAKDTANSISKTVKQISNGQYRSAKLYGTKETVAKLNPKLAKNGLSKTAESSGISSETTKAIATKAGVSGTTGLSKACMTAAKSSAISGGLVSGGFAIIKGVIDISSDEKDLGEVLLDVGKETAGGALAAAGAGAASTACGAVVATGLAAMGATGAGVAAATVGLPIVAAAGVGILIKSLWDCIWD